MSDSSIDLDVLIFGGGSAGLWLLDELHRRSFRVLLIELHALGSGQTIASQGILHGGLKYALSGIQSASSDSVREMPAIWRACLEGRGQPDLRDTRVLSLCCYLWRTGSMISRLGMLGARIGLRTPVEKVASSDRPAALIGCPGEVFRVDEPVIDVGSCLATLASRHSPRMIGIKDPCNVAVEAAAGQVNYIRLQHPNADEALFLRPGVTILCAGEGNEVLRRAMGLSNETMQRRPLHMVMVRGPRLGVRGSLPPLFGHCVDGSKTRVTVTSAADSQGRTVWYVGGELAERGVEVDSLELIAHARGELMSVLPGVDLSETQWATFRINRAEGKSPDGRRPEGPIVRRDGSMITAWPTKLVLVPKLARMIADGLAKPSMTEGASLPMNWPRPEIARPPWETIDEWHA